MNKRTVTVVGDQIQVQMMFMQSGYEIIHERNLKKTPDLVCFTGGMDIHPRLYGEDVLLRTVTHEMRDRNDLNAYKRFSHLPKVGICRGGQLLNVLSGGKLWQHVTNHAEDHFCFDLLNKKKVLVSSTHHQMMDPGPDAVVLGISSFNRSKMYLSANSERKPPKVEPEVIWYETTNSLCFQPHPEKSTIQNKECREYFFDLLDYFF